MDKKSTARMRVAALFHWVGTKIMFIVLVAVGIVLGYGLRGAVGPAEPMTHTEHTQQSTAAEKAQVWTCSMHPDVKLPKPGLCPICRMPLIPLEDNAEEGAAGAPRLTISEASKKMMNLQTSEAHHRFVSKEIRMVGKVDFDETKLSYITAWVPGRIDKLYVDYTGVEVNKGDHMVYLYSPELLTAQEELRRAAKTVKEMKASAPEILKKTTQSTLKAAREKLRLWGLTDQQIEKAEVEGKSSDHITIYAPSGGTVIHRNGQEGMYVETGTPIYTIADLNNVWIKLDAYESDLPWIRYGQTISFTTESHPGEVFEGKIAFIDPVLDKKTRTVKVRVNVPNTDGKLKPEMFVRAIVRSRVATSGRVMDPDLAGKWIGPMHPEIVQDHSGACPVCGMPLVKAEDLGYVALDSSAAEMPLVIPATAPLITGTRAIVYVQVPDAEKPTYEGREIVLGARAGDFYIVKSGLKAGEKVVTNGNFKIDSALQILAKPSMMSPGGGRSGGGHQHGGMDMGGDDGRENSSMDMDGAKEKESKAPAEFQAQLGNLFEGYLDVQDALAEDNLDDAQQAVNKTQTLLGTIDMALLKGEPHRTWMNNLAGLKDSMTQMLAANDIDAARAAFSPLSEALWSAINTFGVQTNNPIYQANCPMAFGDEGANWLQATKDIRNPYLGASMLSCGSVIGTMESSSN